MIAITAEGQRAHLAGASQHDGGRFVAGRYVPDLISSPSVAAARVAPSGENATAQTGAPASKVRSITPLRQFHSLTVPSPLPDANNEPSGENAAVVASFR